MLHKIHGEDFEIPCEVLGECEGSGKRSSEQFNSVAEKSYYLSKPYPNPVTNESTVEYNALDNTEIILYDIMGRIQANYQVSGNGKLIFSAKNFQPGIYFYLMSVDGNVLAKEKLIIIH